MENGNEIRLIDTHHDGHGLNESIRVEAGPIGPGGSSHAYHFTTAHVTREGDEARHVGIGFLQFQQGARHEEGSTPGLTTAAVIAALIDHLQGFQNGPYPSRETALTITKLEEALHWTRHRADARARRGVLGKETK